MAAVSLNYLEFLKRNLRDSIRLINSYNQKQISQFFRQLKKNASTELQDIERYFKSLEAPLSKEDKHEYSNIEKLSLYINFYNLKLTTELLFKHIAEDNPYPENANAWLEFLQKIRFRLLGTDMHLLDFEFSVLRQNLSIPKLPFLQDLFSVNSFIPLTKKDFKNAFLKLSGKLPTEYLVRLTTFNCSK